MIGHGQDTWLNITMSVDMNWYVPYWYRLRDTDLVYLQNTGCAGKYFRKVLQEAGFTHCEMSSVRPGQDRIFSHLIDPIERRHRGVAIFFKIREFSPEWLQDQNCYILEAPYFDQHAEPISRGLAPYYQHIDWIPLDDPDIDAYAETSKILEEYGITVSWPDPEYVEDIRTLEFLGIIKAHYKSSSMWDNMMVRAFRDDIAVYQKACAKRKNQAG